MSQEKHEFQAEVARLLDIVAHSLYSNKEIFLRELISNASDACDRLRYAALTDDKLMDGDATLRIVVETDAKERRLTVVDNGIGMDRDELVENLGTIAHSGTSAFLDKLGGDGKPDLNLIGQFGVGFYSAFMVASRVDVVTRRAGDTAAWHWHSDGGGHFTVDEGAADAPRGTRVTLQLAKENGEFLEAGRIQHVVKTYSDHIALPIVLKEFDDKGAPKGERQINTASALWSRPKNEITDKQYHEFYHHVAHAFDEPWLTLHNKAEGVIEYTNLVFIPSAKPLDLFHPERRHWLKLYVRRIFITDNCEELLPAWLRFLRGIVDSEDLPLNISREMLQHNPVLAKIRAALTKRVLTELKTKADKAADEYAKFWDNFGAVLKEGLYETSDYRDELLRLARFRSTHGEDWTTLADYAGRMKEGQAEIYYAAGDELAALRHSPQIEGFKAKGIEVLLLTDPVDEFWLPSVGAYDGKTFQSVTKGDIDLDKFEATDGKKDDQGDEGTGIASLTALFKLTLKDAVKDVRASRRLTDSPVCLVADEGDVDMHLERMLRQHKQIDDASKRILELNPGHPLIKHLAAEVSAKGDGVDMADVAHLLLDQARIAEGEVVPDAAAFSRRLSAVLTRRLGV